jgi:RimJ/RimL family protein N-acetyltransferase
MALIDHWPLFGLRVTTPRLELRPPTDDDLDVLVRVARAVHDPAMMPFTIPWTDVASPEFERETLRYWWRCRSEFSPNSWDLGLAVSFDGELVGMQNLAATNFPVLRTAETGSWLGQQYHGQGIGKEMRFAALHLAFEALEALAITSAAYTDNIPSQRVSQATGYQPNGTTFALRRGERGEQIRYRLTADRWAENRPHFPIEVDGFDACRSTFGLTG